MSAHKDVTTISPGLVRSWMADSLLVAVNVRSVWAAAPALQEVFEPPALLDLSACTLQHIEAWANHQGPRCVHRFDEGPLGLRELIAGRTVRECLASGGHPILICSGPGVPDELDLLLGHEKALRVDCGVEADGLEAAVGQVASLDEETRTGLGVLAWLGELSREDAASVPELAPVLARLEADPGSFSFLRSEPGILMDPFARRRLQQHATAAAASTATAHLNGRSAQLVRLYSEWSTRTVLGNEEVTESLERILGLDDTNPESPSVEAIFSLFRAARELAAGQLHGLKVDPESYVGRLPLADEQLRRVLAEVLGPGLPEASSDSSSSDGEADLDRPVTLQEYAILLIVGGAVIAGIILSMF